MNMEKVIAAAALLMEARRSGRPITAMPLELVPEDSAEAYAIQREMSAALGPIGGWKVGAKGPSAEPSCAPLPSSLMHPSPYAFTFPCPLGVEAEIAVRLKKDLPPRAQPYSIDDVRAAVGSIHPAIEVVGSRFAYPGRESPLTILADALSNTAFVYGSGTDEDIDIDQTRQAVTLFFGSTLVADTVGGNPAGDIWRLLAWLANHVAANDGGLRAGQIVTTGSCTGLLVPEPGTTVRAALDGLGDVEAVLA